MATETILQNWVVSKFVLPFLLIFFIVYGVLEKTKAFGDKSKQLHAFVAFVIGLIFVGAVFPKVVVGNLILFFTVAIVVLLVTLLLWGFVTGEEAKLPEGKLAWAAGGVIVLAVAIALFYILGIQGVIFDALFRQSWSADLWTNIAFFAVIIIALALVLKTKSE